jgi:hypothetical protein
MAKKSRGRMKNLILMLNAWFYRPMGLALQLWKRGKYCEKCRPGILDEIHETGLFQKASKREN